jgi:hypothetical protein
MKKSLFCLGLMLLLVAAFAVGAEAAPPKLEGDWFINGKSVKPNNQPGGTTQVFPANTLLTIYPTDDPTLFYGTLTGPEGDPNYMTIMMDNGANMHFTVSNNMGPSGLAPGEYWTHTTGRGTANTKKITGFWTDDRGNTGNFIMTRVPQ